MLTIYGDYVAPAVASHSSPWHIQGVREELTLCGQLLPGLVRRMTLHVSLLECSSCMRLGTEKYEWLNKVLEIRSCKTAHCTVIWFENRFSLHSSHDVSISNYSCYPSLREDPR